MRQDICAPSLAPNRVDFTTVPPRLLEPIWFSWLIKCRWAPRGRLSSMSWSALFFFWQTGPVDQMEYCCIAAGFAINQIASTVISRRHLGSSSYRHSRKLRCSVEIFSCSGRPDATEKLVSLFVGCKIQIATTPLR